MAIPIIIASSHLPELYLKVKFPTVPIIGKVIMTIIIVP
jgi:hypothetical protein